MSRSHTTTHTTKQKRQARHVELAYRIQGLSRAQAAAKARPAQVEALAPSACVDRKRLAEQRIALRIVAAPPEPAVPEIDPAHDPVEVPFEQPNEWPDSPQPTQPQVPNNPPIYGGQASAANSSIISAAMIGLTRCRLKPALAVRLRSSC